jgi:hypothetical protein
MVLMIMVVLLVWDIKKTTGFLKIQKLTCS